MSYDRTRPALTLAVALAAGVGGYFAGRAGRTIESNPPHSKTEASAAQDAAGEPRAAAPETKADAPPPAKVDEPKPPAAASPRARLFAALFPAFSDKKLGDMLWRACLDDPALQRRLFELLLAENDPELLDAAQDMLIAIRDPALLKDILAAWENETLPARRNALAYIVGANGKNPVMAPAALSILSGGDSPLQERALTRFCLQNFEADPPADFVKALRLLAQHGGTETVRSRAAGAMRGAEEEEDVRFLISLVKSDSSDEVRFQAMQALPIYWSTGSEFEEDQARAVGEVALDPARAEKLRRECADQALDEADHFPGLFTAAELAKLKELSPRSR
ncbi:MAG: hypothetical protein FD180_2979 [Planctomycetota bacterium]|nr:MAG: hypothetical protein FD180_2979 [Planctomycetota bacterium]